MLFLEEPSVSYSGIWLPWTCCQFGIFILWEFLIWSNTVEAIILKKKKILWEFSFVLHRALLIRKFLFKLLIINIDSLDLLQNIFFRLPWMSTKETATKYMRTIYFQSTADSWWLPFLFFEWRLFDILYLWK